jgi:hypothetical protein
MTGKRSTEIDTSTALFLNAPSKTLQRKRKAGSILLFSISLLT